MDRLNLTKKAYHHFYGVSPYIFIFAGTKIENMKFNLICIGKTDDKEINQLISYYTTRLPKHWNFEIITIPDVKNAKNLSPNLLKKEEAKCFMNLIDSSDLVVLLDEKGKEYTSRQLSEKIYQRANEKISLSKMTFTHQMIRLFFIEQIYRASTILQGKPYHND